MKASSTRKIDVRDTVFLSSYLGLTTAQQIAELHDRWYPNALLDESAREGLADVEAILDPEDPVTIPGIEAVIERAQSLRGGGDQGDPSSPST